MLADGIRLMAVGMVTVFGFLTILVAVMTPAMVHAEETSATDRAAAQVLFDEGRKLTESDDWEQACVKFQESMRLHPATGTQLNLARCYEKINKLASAWINWVEAKDRAIAAGRNASKTMATTNAATAIARKLSSVTSQRKPAPPSQSVTCCVRSAPMRSASHPPRNEPTADPIP